MSALTVHNAEIKTAAVEIRTLTISGKQVTLAVFRQLREDPLIAEDGTLNGVPWGTVNYHPDKCGNATEHWHMVWQRGPDLLRSRVNKVPGFPSFRSDDANAFMTAIAWEVLQEGGTSHFNGNPPKPSPDFGGPGDLGKAVRWIANGSVSVASEVSEAVADVLQYQGYNRTRRRADVCKEYEQLGSTAREIRERINPAIIDEAKRQKRHRDLIKTLADLPQLFIAV